MTIARRSGFPNAWSRRRISKRARPTGPGVIAAIEAVTSAPRIAYLTNLYPAISHSFIRTEIEALERAGVMVDRFTIRPADIPAGSPDRVEADRTRILLTGRGMALIAALVRQYARQPLLLSGIAARALRMACRGGIGVGRVMRTVAYLGEAAVLADALRRSGARHVHAHFGTNPATVAQMATRMTGGTFSFTVHGPDEFDAPVELDLRGKIAEAAFVVAVSSFGRSQLMRWSDPRDWDRIRVISCSVAPLFLAPQPEPVALRRLVCVARLSAQKGLPLLIEAAGRLGGEADFLLDIVGDGDQRGAIEARIAELGLESRVRLLGWCAPDVVLSHVSNARAFVLPSFAEGLPVGIMEAMALGRPVIATAIAGIPELVDRETGWLIPAGSVGALADAMRDALDAPIDRLVAMGKVGQARVRTRHDPDANARALAALFARIG